MAASAQDKVLRKHTVARSALLGVLILAAAAIFMAWVDETGIGYEIMTSFEKGRY